MVNDFIFCSPEEVGLDSARISKFIERLKERKVNLHSFMIVRKGKVLTEAYYKPFDKDFMHRLYSSSKTYVAIAVGMLIGEGIKEVCPYTLSPEFLVTSSLIIPSESLDIQSYH